MKLYQSVGYLMFGTRLKRLSETFLNDVNKLYKKQKIQFDASWFPIFYLLSQESEISIKQIAENLYISHSAASQMVSHLQEKGFITSVVSKKDGRLKVVTLTTKGTHLLQKIEPLWAVLQNTMEELVQEYKHSQKILQALTEIENALNHKTLLNRLDEKLK